MRRWRTIALWVFALLPSVILVLLSGWFIEEFVWQIPLAKAPPRANYPVWSDIALMLIPAGALLVSTVGTISTIWLAWRKERRDSREYTLKIQQLEMQLAELQKSSGVKKAD
jgi:hypothetical protein